MEHRLFILTQTAAVLIILGLYTAAPAASQPAAPGDDLVVAEVGNEKITQADLSKELNRHFRSHLAELDEAGVRLLKKQLLKRMVERRLLVRAAKKAEQYPGQQTVDDELKNIESQYESADDFASLLHTHHLNREEFRQGLQDDLAIRAYMEKVIFSEIAVSEDAVRQSYDIHSAKYRVPEEIRARHILIKTHPSMSDDQVAERKAQAEQILELVNRPNSKFSEIAKEHSQGPGRSKGGDLGYFTKNQHDAVFSQAAFNLEPGEVSGVVRTKHGFHIIKVENKRGGADPAYESVKERVKADLLEERKRAALEDHLAKLNKESRVIVYLH